MRLPNVDENLVGKVCVCSVGRAAIVTGKRFFSFNAGRSGYSGLPQTECWVGIGFDGKGTWASTSPAVVAEDAQEFHDKLATRFGGKMSFNG